MKYSFLEAIILLTFLVGCAKNAEPKKTLHSNAVQAELIVPNRTVDQSLLVYNNKTSLWTLNGHLYSGYATKLYETNTLKEKFGILNGRKQNLAITWYPDGHYRQVKSYHLGKLHGEKKTWSSDSEHLLISHLNYHSGKAHGEQKIWYSSGELFKHLNLNMGKEEGMQKAFRKNGDLYANYEAKDGRTFGLKKAALCYSLEDENIQYE